jgi:membrane-associated phospholipid phosphatase
LGVNTSLFLSINDFARATPWLNGPAAAFAWYGLVLFAGLLFAGLLFAGLLFAGWWIARRDGEPTRMAAAVWAPIGVLIAVAVNQPIADLANVARPYSVLPDILVLAARSTDPGLPSDHAVMAGAVTAGLFLVNRRLGVIAAVLALLMAFSRVYIAAHYPLDVLAGLGLGAAVSLAGYALARRLLTRIVVALESTRLRPLLAEPAAGG